MRGSLLLALLAMVTACNAPEQSMEAGKEDFSGVGRTDLISATAVPCDTPNAPTAYIRTRLGELSAEVPAGWQAGESQSDKKAFYVPSLSDPEKDAYTVVLVGLPPKAPTRTFRATSDSIVNGIATSVQFSTVLIDSVSDDRHRHFWWQGAGSQAPLSVFSNFGEADGQVVVTVISLPVLRSQSQAELAAFSRDAGHFLSSMTVNGERVFPGWTTYPTVECYDDSKAPASGARG